MEFKRYIDEGRRNIPTIESEKWVPHPEKKGVLQFAGMRTYGEVFKELEAHLEEMGMMPDEYFLPSYTFRNQDNEPLPQFNKAICSVNFGGSEGIYLDISLACYNHGESEYISFATGKTLSDDVEAYYKMSMIGAECSLMLNGRGEYVRLGERNLNISVECVEKEKEKPLDVVLDSAIVRSQSSGGKDCVEIERALD